MIRVLFVCMGNICRSPMAEAVFTQHVREAGLSGQFEIDSAGTSGYHSGEPAHHGTLRILREHQISYNGRSRPLVADDLTNFDYIIAMDADNLHGINRLGTSTGLVARLLDFAPEMGAQNVPDPYYNNGFQEVYELVEAGSRGLLTKIRQDHHL